MSPDGKGCTDKNECLDSPCRNGGVCINQDPRLRYRCVCLDGFWGENCELVQEGQTLKLGMGALAAILVCLLTILSKSLPPYTHISSFCPFPKSCVSHAIDVFFLFFLQFPSLFLVLLSDFHLMFPFLNHVVVVFPMQSM